MPLLRKGIALPVKGADYSVPATFTGDDYGFPSNMIFSKGELRKRPGKTVQGSQISDATPIMGYGKLELVGNVKHLVRASRAKLQRLNTGTGDWVSISNTDFTGDATKFFDFVNVTESQILLITNGFDKIRKWTGSGNNAVLGGNPPLAKYITYLSPYVLIANLVESGTDLPWRIDWCDTDAPENWSSGNAGSYLAADEPSEIQNLKKLNDFVTFYKKESIGVGRKVDPPDIFRFETIQTGIGLAAPRSVVDAEGRHYFQGFNDFFVWNGIRAVPIGAKVRDEAFTLADPDKFDRCFAIHVQKLNEVWFFIVQIGSDYPEHVWRYKYTNDFWYQDTCSSITAAIRWERTTSLVWDDATGTWDQQQIVWNDASTTDAWEEIMFGNSTGYSLRLDYTTTNDNSVAVTAAYVTKDFTAGNLEQSERWLQLDVWAYGPGKMYVDYSSDFGSNWTNIPYTSSQAYADLTSVVEKYEFYLDVWKKNVRFRIRNGETGESLIINSICPYYLSREEVWTRR